MKHDIYVFIACQQSIRQGKSEVIEMTKLGKPGAAHLPRKSRLSRKRSLPHQFYYDAPHEQTHREPMTVMTGYVSESTVDSRAIDPEASDTEWHSASVSVRGLAPAAEADEDMADFHFGDGPSSGAAPGAASSDGN